MEIFTLLETLEEMLESSKSIPFSNKGIVDKEEMLEIIKEIRLKLPEELKQAKWVKEERQRILVEAQKEAENRIISMIDEHEITRKAYDQKTVKKTIHNLLTSCGLLCYFILILFYYFVLFLMHLLKHFLCFVKCYLHSLLFLL